MCASAPKSEKETTRAAKNPEPEIGIADHAVDFNPEWSTRRAEPRMSWAACCDS